jgi:hypothetical protein
MAGVTTDTGVSYDIAPALAGGTGAREFAYVEHFESGGQPEGHRTFGWAIRDARDKRAMVDGAAAMLFDLAADPFAQTDLLAGTATPQTTAEVKSCAPPVMPSTSDCTGKNRNSPPALNIIA